MLLRTKVIMILVLLSLVPLTLVGVFAYTTGKSAIERRLGSSFEHIARETTNKVDRGLYEVYRNVQAWAELELMQETVSDDLDGKITSFLMGLSKEYGYYSDISVLNKQGAVVASSRPEWIGKDFKDEYSYRDDPDGKVAVRDVHFDAISQAWVVGFSSPIRAKFSNNRSIGLLVVKWKADRLSDFIQPGQTDSVEEYFKVVLIRRDGLLISDPAFRGNEIFKHNLVESGFKSAGLASQMQNGYRVENDGTGKAFLIGYNYSKGFNEFASLGWAALVIEGVDTAFEPIERLKMIVLGVWSVVAFLIAAIALIVTQRVTHPILHMSGIAGKVARGDFDTKLEYSSQDEIGTLTQAFNRMIQDLKAQRAQLVEKDYVDSIIASMINSLIVIDDMGLIKRVNKATLDLLKYTEDELMNQTVWTILARELLGTGSGSLVETGIVNNMEVTYRAKDGRRIPVLLSGSILRDREGRIQGTLLVAQNITELKEAERRLEYLANFDSMTGLPNRNLFMDRLKQAVIHEPRVKRFMAVLFLDLDHFKTINDTLGHAFGDLLLKAVAERLPVSLRGGDTVARLGGDEFTILLEDIVRVEDAARVAQKILDSIGQPLILNGRELFITTSIGISVFPDDGEDAEMLLKNADTAMYRAKEQGRNNYQHFSQDMNLKAMQRLALETRLRQAIEHQELFLHYQPLVSLASGEVVGMEALVRWRHPEFGLISPTQFIPLAEETGLIISIGEWVLQTACAQNKAWQEAGLKPIRIAVNLSGRQLQPRKLEETVGRILEKTGLRPEYLDLELTETVSQDAVTIKILHQLKNLGLQITIDDFGTGYSSLSYLKDLPVHTLKIDQSFVRDLTSDTDDAAIVKTIISLAHHLGLRVVAEAVETKEQLEFLRSVDCDEVQGYFCSRPQTTEEAAKFLSEGRRFEPMAPRPGPAGLQDR